MRSCAGSSSAGRRASVVDLRELSFISACGVSRLVAARRRARRAGWRLVLVRGRAIAPLLTLTALEQTFEVVNDVPSRLREPPVPAARAAGAPASDWSGGSGAGAGDRRRPPSEHATR